jgi:sterol desaturase/sphingolipid hydroxylase (fatty acid hydroxylase superfamily)
MNEMKFGRRDRREHYIPNKRVGYPPVFVWPVQPFSALKWLIAIPGYFMPWNVFYVIVGLVAWFLLSPALESFASPSFETVIFLFFRNAGFVAAYFGAFHLRLYIQRRQDIKFKFNPVWPQTGAKKFMFGSQTVDNIILTIGSGVTIWTGFEIGLLYLAANDFLILISPIDQPIYFLVMIFTVHLWRDLHFYLVHRLIHWGPLYRLAHNVHHKNINPGPWSGLAMHPVEHLLYFSCAFIYLLFPFHPAFIVITLIHAGLSPAPGHAGFERVVLDDGRSVDLDCYAHYLHHKYFECNYADGILPLDKWFGTFHDGSTEAQKKMRDRLKENLISKTQ